MSLPLRPFPELFLTYSRYKLAEKLSENLDEMGKDLTSMIEEVNGASATLTKTNRADEPVCKTQPIRYLQLLTHVDLPNRPHPQLAPLPTATHRPRHRRAPEQGRSRPKSWTVYFFSPGIRIL